MATGNPKFPGLEEKYVMEIEQRTANAPAAQKQMLQQQMYSDYYAQQKREQEQNERLAMTNQMASMQLDPQSKQPGSKYIQKKANLANVIRNYYGMTLSDGDDDAIIQKFTSSIKNGNQMYVDYLNGDNNDIMLKTGLLGDTATKLNNIANQHKLDQSGIVVKEQERPTNLTSTSHFDDPEYAKYYLDNIDKDYQPFVKAAREAGYPDWQIASLADAKKTYDDFLARGLGDKMEEVNVGTFQGFVNFFGNAYNNLLGENPYVGVAPKLNMSSIQFNNDLLGAGNNYGNLRAESGWSKGGEIFGDLLANTAVMMLLPGIGGEAKMESLAESALKDGTKGVLRNVGQRMTYGAIEGTEFGALATMGQEDANLDKLQSNMVGGATIGSVFGLGGAGWNAYKYRNILRTSLKEGDKANTVKNLLEMFDKGVKPTSRGMKTNTQLQQYNDDALGAVETIIKNKDGLKYIDINGEETFGHLPRNLDEFSQAIKQTKQSIYNDYTAIAREAGKETSVDTSNIVKDLKSKLNNKEGTAGWDDATKARIQKWINDLEELNNTMSVEGTQNKIQELNQKIQTFIKNGNPNDVGTNAVDGWVLNGLKSSLDDAIENAGLDSEQYFALRNAYKQLRAIESDVNHRTIVYGRQNPESLVDSMANLSSIDAIAKFLKNPKESALKFAGSQLEKISAKSRNNPNKIIDKMFREADDTISKSDTLKTQAQLAGERTEKQQYNIRKTRQQRMEERQARYEQREAARQAAYEKQNQQEAAYQEYLKSKGVGSETQALPEGQQTNNYNTIISNDPNPITVTPEGDSFRKGQIAEINKKSGNIENQDYNYSSLDSNQIINDGQRATNNGDSINGLDRGGDQGMVGEASLTDFGASQGGAGTSQQPITITDGNEMVNLSKNLQSKHERGLFMDIHTPEEYSSYKNFTNPNKSAAISVKPDGDIINFVSTEKGAGKDLMIQAIDAGGNKMDNYGVGLTQYYENFGFEPVARVKFNKEYAPEGWNFARDGEPDIFVMKHNGESPATVREKYGTYKHKTPAELEKLPEMDYDTALKYRDNKIKLSQKPQSDLKTSEDVLKYSQDNKDTILELYRAEKGNYVNPDDFRDFINDGRRLLASETQDGASWLAEQYFDQLIKENPGGKGLVIAGGPGGGKGTSLKVLGEKGQIDTKGADIIVDKTKGTKEVKKMRDNGMLVEWDVVVPNADGIVDNIIGRAVNQNIKDGLGKGRTLPINGYGIPTHKEVAQIAKDLYKESKNSKDLIVRFIDNTGKKEEINIKEGVDGLKLIESFQGKLDNITESTVKKSVDAAYKKGDITKKQRDDLIKSLIPIIFVGGLLYGSNDKES